MMTRSIIGLIRRSLTTTKLSHSPVLSELVKQLSKFSSHDELLEYCQRPIQHCYPNRMIAACSSDNFTSTDLIKSAFDLHQQMLVRIAHGIYYFQSLPFLPAANPILLSLHERYLKLFETFSRFPSIKTDDDAENFAQMITFLLKQTHDTIGQLSAGCQEAHRYFKSYRTMREFLDDILKNRLAMRLLAEHYLQLHKQVKKGKVNDRWRGAFDMKFSPKETVQQCIEDISSICLEEYSVAPHVAIENNIDQTFPYFPKVVEYILRELIKNSMRAIVEYYEFTLGNVQSVKRYFEDRRDAPLCKIFITSDREDEHFTIAIKDLGGGINEHEDQIFRYMFTGNSFLFSITEISNRSRRKSVEESNETKIVEAPSRLTNVMKDTARLTHR